MKTDHFRILAAAWAIVAVSCQNYVESTPREYFEDNNRENYKRVFREDLPDEVTVVNSIVVGYEHRIGLVTTDDFEFELVVPRKWIDNVVRKEKLIPGIPHEIERRKNNSIREWYAPKNMDQYQAYRDRTSVGYVHLLVDKSSGDDGFFTVFYSKH